MKKRLRSTVIITTISIFGSSRSWLAYYFRSLTVCVVTEVISFVSSGISLVELYHVMLAAGLAPLTYRMNDHDEDDGGGGNRKRQVDDVESTYKHTQK